MTLLEMMSKPSEKYILLCYFIGVGSPAETAETAVNVVHCKFVKLHVDPQSTIDEKEKESLLMPLEREMAREY